MCSASKIAVCTAQMVQKQGTYVYALCIVCCMCAVYNYVGSISAQHTPFLAAFTCTYIFTCTYMYDLSTFIFLLNLAWHCSTDTTQCLYIWTTSAATNIASCDRPYLVCMRVACKQRDVCSLLLCGTLVQLACVWHGCRCSLLLCGTQKNTREKFVCVQHNIICRWHVCRISAIVQQLACMQHTLPHMSSMYAAMKYFHVQEKDSCNSCNKLALLHL